ncbi:MAG: polyprenyl diphosphate synthase [Patescibacteria group bacterium]
MSHIPKHIGFIMDGNRRWAKERFLTTGEGHAAGAENISTIVEACAKRGVETVTIYAFSTENFKNRSQKEISILFGLLAAWISRKSKLMKEQGVRLAFLGDLTKLPDRLQHKIQHAVDVLKHNERIKCNILLNYGGRPEIIRAMQEIVREGKTADEINEELISNHLYTKGQADPDLMIRTGGEMRVSNFLIWQLSYSELYFTDTYWPDFNADELDKALVNYAARERRFGGDAMVKQVI